jgi:hypothetical protein
MASISTPKISVQLQAAGIVDAFADRRDLIVGQAAPAGHAIDGQLYTDVQLLPISQIDYLFGPASDVAHRVKRYIDGSGGITSLDVIPKYVAPASLAATATITMPNPVVQYDDTITLAVVDEYQYIITFDVTAGNF